ncbi:MAG: hypothetical protein EOM90_11445 [Alphaproteobacteria bacterium]|nr:hypothetical protein [Alphaproteobacteria bacterium]
MPSFKSNLDLQQHQLLNAVLHNLPDLPQNPVEGQVYYNTAKFTAYLWNGTSWIPWGEFSGGGSIQQVKQYVLNIPNPSANSSTVFVRLYEDQTVVRIDSRFSNTSRVDFNIECRTGVNVQGLLLTQIPIQAAYEGTETTVFSFSALPKDTWLYFSLAAGDGAVGTPADGEGLPPTGATENGEIEGLLTITITCIKN